MARPADLLVLSVLVGLVGCGTDTLESRPDAGRPDALVCNRPPNIRACLFPPNGSCPSKVLCLSCNCTGAVSVYACDGATGDCRWFCTGCYPETYTLCDKNAPKHIVQLCGYCYVDAGAWDKCLKVRLDAGRPG